MPRQRQFLLANGIMRSRGGTLEQFAADQEAAMAACPEAARFSDHEVEEFWAAALYLDMLDPQEVAKQIRRAGISYPAELAFDAYRLGRYLFHRWDDPAIREAYLKHGVTLEAGPMERLGRERDLVAFRPSLHHWGGPAVFYLLPRYHLADLIPQLLESYTPEEADRHRALMQYGRLQLHRFLTEAEPARRPSSWERQKVARRVQLREVQMRAMHRSLHKVSAEHRDLQAHLRELARTEHPELRPLAEEWVRLRKQLKEMDRQYQAELAELADRNRQDVAGLRAELASTQEAYRKTVDLRRSWLRVARG